MQDCSISNVLAVMLLQSCNKPTRCLSLFQESFLEDVNCILNSGEVPDLFDNEEIDGIAMELKSAAAEAQIPDTRSDVYNFFIRVRNFLSNL